MIFVTFNTKELFMNRIIVFATAIVVVATVSCVDAMERKKPQRDADFLEKMMKDLSIPLSKKVSCCISLECLENHGVYEDVINQHLQKSSGAKKYEMRIEEDRLVFNIPMASDNTCDVTSMVSLVLVQSQKTLYKHASKIVGQQDVKRIAKIEQSIAELKESSRKQSEKKQGKRKIEQPALVDVAYVLEKTEDSADPSEVESPRGQDVSNVIMPPASASCWGEDVL